jgi:spore coat polysaccharide biosynthesis protein SpsF
MHSVLTLGTVQIGTPYGVANDKGIPSDAEVSALLHDAADIGITTLDTARAYGRSEQRIGDALSSGLGDCLRVVTKLDVIDRSVTAEASSAAVRNTVDASVLASAFALRSRRIDTLLLHRWSHRHAFGDTVWRRLVELKRDGLVGRLGASVSEVSEAIAALRDPEVEHLQCPVNLLDHRWRDDEFLAAVRARPDVVVHARSVLLQGLLTLSTSAASWHRVVGADGERLAATLDRLTADLGRLNRIDLCMAYVRGLPWVTSLVIGMESVTQLHQNIAYACRPALTPEQILHVDAAMPALPLAVLDPARWSTVHA